MARKWREWPRPMLDQLSQLIEAGHTYAQVAERLGRPETEVKGAAQRIGLQRQERLGWRRRTDWPEIERIVTDCVEARLMTLPQARDHLAALGYQIGLSTLYKRLESMPRSISDRAKRNGAARKAACCTRMRRRQEMQRRTAA